MVMAGGVAKEKKKIVAVVFLSFQKALSLILAFLLLFTNFLKVESAPINETLLILNTTNISIHYDQKHPVSNSVYEELVDLAKICSISYCTSTNELYPGDFVDACPLKECVNGNHKNSKIIKVFQPPEEQKGPSGFIGINHEKKKIYIVFRGSETNSDWLSNLDIKPTKYIPHVIQNYKVDKKNIEFNCENCLVHRGFYKSLSFFFEDSYSDVQKISQQYPNYQLVITGHSLGGALATLMAVEYKLLGFNPLAVTFGSPKVAVNNAMSKAIDNFLKTLFNYNNLSNIGNLESGLYRVIHKGDFVPLLPPSYKHVGTLLTIDKFLFPHEQKDLKAVLPTEENEESLPPELTTENINSDSWKESYLKYYLFRDHRNYFIRISGCVDRTTDK